MRFCSFMASLALLLSISSVATQTLMAGIWFVPSSIEVWSTNSYCCVPDSIRIYCSSSSSSSCTATFNYPEDLNKKCWNLFQSSTSGKMTIYKIGSGDRTEIFYSEKTFNGKMTFNFGASNTTGYPILTISGAPPIDGSCYFTMRARKNPTFDVTGFVIFIIVFIIFAAGSAKYYQKRQAAVIIAQNLAQPVVSVQRPTPVIEVQQGFVQPQPTYVAPNQFPNNNNNDQKDLN